MRGAPGAVATSTWIKDVHYASRGREAGRAPGARRCLLSQATREDGLPGRPVQRTREIAAGLVGRNKRATGRASVSCWPLQAGPALQHFPRTADLSKRVLRPDAVIRLHAVHRERGTAE